MHLQTELDRMRRFFVWSLLRYDLENDRIDLTNQCQKSSEPTMTEKGDTGLIWEFRLALWLPRPLVFGALFFVACFVAIYLGFQWAFDFRIDRVPLGYGLTIGFALTVARIIAASTFKREGHEGESPVSDRHDREVQALQLPLDRIRSSRLAGAVGVLAFAGLIEVTDFVNGYPLMSAWDHLHDRSATMAMTLLMGWFFGRFIFLSINVFSLIGPIAKLPAPQKSDVDLLNLDKLYDIGRSGLPIALVWLVSVAIGILASPVTWSNNLWFSLPVLAVSLGVALVALLRPALSVRSLIRAVKREQLARLEPLLPRARDGALTGDESTHGRLTDLLAYKDRIESTPEWPFDSSTTFRSVLYLLIPICSMVAGTFVDRVVSTLLD